MSDMQFANNYRDLSNSTGVDAGFQFEFYCQRCSDRWRTHYKPYRSGQASGWLQKGASMFGGMLGNASSVLTGMAQAGWHTARRGVHRSGGRRQSPLQPLRQLPQLCLRTVL